MKLSHKILSVLLISGLSVAGFADARPRGGEGKSERHGKMGKKGGKNLMRLFRGLDLTEAQEIALVKARRKLREDAPKNDQGAADKKTLVDQLKSGSPDKTVLYGLADARAERKKARAHAQIDAFLSVYATLSPEQKQQLAERAERRSQEQKKRGRKGMKRR